MKRLGVTKRLILFLAMALALSTTLAPLAAWGQATWGDDQIISNPDYNANEPCVAMDGSNVVVVWQQFDNSGYSNGIYSNCSSDSGQNWSTPQLIDGVGADTYEPQVAICGSNVVAVWQQYDSASSCNVVYSRHSSDGGQNWGTIQLIDTVDYDALFPQVAMDGLNVVAAWYEYDISHIFRICSNRATIGGGSISWSSEQIIDSNTGYGAQYPKIAIDGLNVVVVWQELDSTSTPNVYSNYSADGGINWDGAQLIEACADDANGARVAIDGSNVVAVWKQMDASSDWRIYSSHATIGSGSISWAGAQLIESNAGCFAESPDVAINGSNVVAVWYQICTNSRIYSNHATINGAISWYSSQLIEDNSNSGYWAELGMDGSNVIAVWCQYYNGDRRVYSNYSEDGGATWESDQLIEDNVGYDALYLHIAMDGSNAVAVWRQRDDSGYWKIYSNYATLGETEPTPPAPPPDTQTVGGTVYPAEKISILLPCAALAVFVIAGGVWLVHRRANR